MWQKIFDRLSALICIFLLSPLYLLVAVLIKVESKGPVFFVQERVGYNQCPFKIYKFRSMVVNDYDPQVLGPVKHNHAIVTKVGYWLRRTKLDEIPQFFNVLCGDMSMVGPRPCLFSTLKLMRPHELRRFKVLPGMTGWAEVNGNVELTWNEQLALDLWYVDHRSLCLDIHILFKTLATVLFGSIKNVGVLKQAQAYEMSLQGKDKS